MTSHRISFALPCLAALALAVAACGDNTRPELCGNGRLDVGEKCDPLLTSGPGACPTSCGHPCDVVTGSATACTAECVTADLENPPTGCTGVCGNGTVDSGETCDTAIAAGEPGACPTTESCDDDMFCTEDTISGVGCQAVCANTAITAAADDDLCCPAGADSGTDNDCPNACGNGVVDVGETCDIAIGSGAGSCPDAAACNDMNACTTDTVVSAGTCQDRCSNVANVAAGPADSCCPPGANLNTDPDCTAVCGNGAIEGTEKCDTGIAAGLPGACPTSVAACNDNNTCTTDALTGAGCNAECTRTTLAAGPDDACCPPGASANNDPNCLAVCGNGVVETGAGESCDTAVAGSCPANAAACNDMNACTTDTAVGSGCGRRCEHDDVTACVMAQDGCCPPGCTGLNDGDCSLTCGDGVVQANETCDTGVGSPTPCPMTPADCNDNDACTADAVQSPGTCNAVCVHAEITSLASGDMCCPDRPDANNNSDADCPVVCGNGVEEAGEECDTAIAAGMPGACPTACNDGDSCTTDTLDNPGTCDAVCAATPITPCCGNGVKEMGETCDVNAPPGPDACPTSCDDSNACTSNVLQNGGTCTATCSFPDIAGQSCCGDGTVEQSGVTNPETCDTAIAAGMPGSCANITCADAYTCTTDVKTDFNTLAMQPANACRATCVHVEVVDTMMSDGCCPPRARFDSNDPDCLCGNSMVNGPAAPPFEQCDDGNATNNDFCNNSCVANVNATPEVPVGAPCSIDADCAYNPTDAGARCITPAFLPPLTTGFVNGYCSKTFCDPDPTDTNSNGIPQAIETCPQLGASPNALCVQPPGVPAPLCVALCNPAAGNEQCRHAETDFVNQYAYRCTVLSASPAVAACAPRTLFPY